ncbi:MAG: hypothetical protein GJ676_13630 [Rhodobacteraceae bacterium]|nr:hypothetical protein [Paracoccaceae bacterium]
MDLTKAILTSQDVLYSTHEVPKNGATAAGISAAVAAGSLVYSMGKDLVPKLRSSEPLGVQILDSQPDDFSEYYFVDLRLTNLGAHSIYIDAVELPQRTCQVGASPFASSGVGSMLTDPTPVTSQAGSINPMGGGSVVPEATFGKTLPFKIPAHEVRIVRLRCKKSQLYDTSGRKPQSHCNFYIEYDDLSLSSKVRSADALFRVRGLSEVRD